jgi:hypothetical protein
VRAIDHETRRLDAIERGEPPPPAPPPIVLPAEGFSPIQEATPSAPVTPAPKGGRERRPPAKKAATPQRSPVVTAPPAPVAGQPQVAPLPPPIDVRPAPGAAKQKPPPPRPPLALTPQVGNPSPRSN